MKGINFINPKEFKVYGLDKEVERIAMQLKNYGKAYSKNNQLPRIFSKKHSKLLDAGFLDISTTQYGKRENKTIYVTAPNVMVLPKLFKSNTIFQLKKLRL